MFYKNGVYKNFAKIAGKHLCWILFLRPAKETPTQLFSCEFCEIFKSKFFKEHLCVTASENKIIIIIIVFFSGASLIVSWIKSFTSTARTINFYGYTKEHRFCVIIYSNLSLLIKEISFDLSFQHIQLSRVNESINEENVPMTMF